MFPHFTAEDYWDLMVNYGTKEISDSVAFTKHKILVQSPNNTCLVQCKYYKPVTR